jgi:hypothetical protein
MNLNDDDLPVGDPAEALRLIERERATLVRGLTPDPLWMYLPWGIAWLIGFFLVFLRYGPGGRVFVDMPEWLPWVTLMVLVVAAGVTTGVVGGRAARQVAGPSNRQGLMYGWTWALAFSGMSVVFSQFSGTLSPGQQSLLWGGGMVALTGAIHMAGAAIWNDRNLFVLGAWTSVVNIVGVVCGVGWHPLIAAVAGGGAMIVFGLAGHRSVR